MGEKVWKEGDTFNLTGHDGKPCRTVEIIRTVVLAGIPGFAIHKYESDDGEESYRVSHIETGTFIAEGGFDGEAFTRARHKVSDMGGKQVVLETIEKTKRRIKELRGR